MTLVSLGSIIGSGWLFGALGAASLAGGGGSLLTWIIAALILGLLALVHAELGSTYPVSGGTARFPFMAFGGLGGFAGGWMAFIQAVTIAPIEVEASLSHLAGQVPWRLPRVHRTRARSPWPEFSGACSSWRSSRSSTPWASDGWPRPTASRWIWKLLIPTMTIFALLFTSFHAGNFTAGGGFAPYGAHGILAALSAGVIFAAEGFEQSIQIGGETKNPQRNIPRALIIAMVIGTVFYLLLDVAFVGALNPANLVHGWTNPLPGVAKLGPYISAHHQAGLGWLATLLVIDAVVSPGGTGLVYLGTSSRLSYGLGRNGYFPKIISKINARGVPLVSIAICFVIGMLTFLPFPSWFSLVGLITSATVIMYAMAPLALAGLRKQDPDRPRASTGCLQPGCCARSRSSPPTSSCTSPGTARSSGWRCSSLSASSSSSSTRSACRPRSGRSSTCGRRTGSCRGWCALLIISWLGRYDGAPPTVFGLTLVATHRSGSGGICSPWPR